MIKDDEIKRGSRTNNLERNKSDNLESAQEEEIVLLKKLLFKIWGVTEILQNDVGFLKRLYTMAKQPKKQAVSREERKAVLKHKLLTRKRKLN